MMLRDFLAGHGYAWGFVIAWFCYGLMESCHWPLWGRFLAGIVLFVATRLLWQHLTGE